MRKNKIVALISAFTLAAGCYTSFGGFDSGNIKTAQASDSLLIPGDVDLDGNVNVTDLSTISLGLVEKKTFTGDRLICADVTYDGKVQLDDLATLKMFLAKKITDLSREAYFSNLPSPKPPASPVPGYNCDPTVPPTEPAAVPSAVPDLQSLKETGEKIGADGYMEFVYDSTPLILLETDDEKGEINKVYSPLSYYTALSMAAECADTTTREEIVNALRADDMEDLRTENNNLLSLYFKDDNSYCSSTNSIWLNDRYIFEYTGINELNKRYKAASFKKDYSQKEQTEKDIQDWIYKYTDNKIKPLIELGEPDKEYLRLINTVVYKNSWKESCYDIKDDTFRRNDGTDVTCKYMRSLENSTVGFGDRYKVCSKKMLHGFSMYFVVPDEKTDINDIVSDNAAMADIYGKNYDTAECKLNMYFPEFEAVSKFDLRDASKKLGIKEAFGKGDFSNIIDCEKNAIDGVRISKIDHEAVLKTDKDGCEGAAYTQIVLVSTAPAPRPLSSLEVTIDRPFFYYIADKNNVPVFAGIIGDPTAKDEQ